MWLWLVVSILILAACAIFALRIFATSDHFALPKKDEKALLQNPSKVLSSIFSRQGSVNDLKEKIKTIEDNYLAQFNRLQQRIDFLDHEKNTKGSKWKEEDDDGGWEELYYKTLKDKEEAEEALEATSQKQEELILKLKELEGKANERMQIQAELEGQQSNVLHFKNIIEIMEREANTALEKERILEEELESVKKVKREHELLQHLYSHLLTEADELKLRIHEITNRDISLTKKINRLSELESNFEMSTYEKSDLRKSVDEIIIENEALSAKLQELQGKLATEKYA